eukprot:gene8096-10967_t
MAKSSVAVMDQSVATPIINADTSVLSLEESMKIETKNRRASQHFSQNIVIENQGRDIRDYYDIDKMPTLGSGISGTVRTCVHKSSKIKYALKILTKKKLAVDKLAQLREEIQFMADLDHPNIIRLNEYFETNDCIYLIMELCKGGELLDRLHEQKGHQYPEKVACKFVYTMLSAITYCHSRNIVHRDLKLENFLFEDSSPTSELKLIDFGLSHYFKPQEVLHSAVGTPYYVAPEVLQGNYDAKCDVWSIGVIAYMLLSGTPPFYGKNDAETLQSVKLGRWKFDERVFKSVSDEAKNFIVCCLTRRVSKRPAAAEAMLHSWFHLCKDPKDVIDSESSVELVSRLKVFNRRPSLSKICMEVVAHTLLPEQISELRKEFMKLDIRNTGEITLGDLYNTLAAHGSFTGEDLSYLMSNIDLERTGKISYHEFLAATISSRMITEENLRVAFEKISNHGEYITKEHIVDLLGQDIATIDPDTLLTEMNLEEGAKINYQQFKQIMNGGVQSPARVSQKKSHQRRNSGNWGDDNFESKYGKNMNNTISASTISKIDFMTDDLATQSSESTNLLRKHAATEE